MLDACLTRNTTQRPTVYQLLAKRCVLDKAAELGIELPTRRSFSSGAPAKASAGLLHSVFFCLVFEPA